MDTKSGYYLPDVGAFDWYPDPDDGPPEGALDAFQMNDRARPVFVVPTDSRPFHIGPSFNEQPAQMIVCARCGGSSFEVGKAAFYTAIRCVTCQWEMCEGRTAPDKWARVCAEVHVHVRDGKAFLPFSDREVVKAGRIAQYALAPGIGWVRLFGYGIRWKDTTRHALLFSERNGHVRCLRIGAWSFSLLGRGHRP